MNDEPLPPDDTVAPAAAVPENVFPPPGADFSAPKDQAKLQAELKEANERVLRAQAELENYRKRARREMEDERKYAALPLVKDLLPVLDNLQRAIDAAGQSAGSGGLLEGVRLVATQLGGLLEKHACKRIPAVGTTFDPHLHEALAQEASSEHPAGSVSRELQAGYQLHERVVRPAQVFVSTGPPA